MRGVLPFYIGKRGKTLSCGIAFARDFPAFHLWAAFVWNAAFCTFSSSSFFGGGRGWLWGVVRGVGLRVRYWKVAQLNFIHDPPSVPQRIQKQRLQDLIGFRGSIKSLYNRRRRPAAAATVKIKYSDGRRRATQRETPQVLTVMCRGRRGYFDLSLTTSVLGDFRGDPVRPSLISDRRLNRSGLR